MTQNRYLCIHGHFYQPPRENPWLEAIELQESAAPYHDWNDRITAECYAPNSAARITDPHGHILGIVNNYAHISFNFGPTLLSWIQTHHPDTYKAILHADQQSIKNFNGHGSAIAQVYNHIIMPHANHRDQETQILWGIQDFQHRFKRHPEGMWLAEAAVSIDTLQHLANHNIKYTILAPRQAHSIRPLADNARQEPHAGWEDVSDGTIDPTRPYLCLLPNGKTITLFFYDGPISQAVAFEGILSSGTTFAERLLTGYSPHRKFPQLLHIATDGETYGHHHKFGDMALAHAIHHIQTNNLAQITNYGQYLELHPPTWEVRINNNSSWSCSHGIQRWASDCGCSSGQHPGWSQQWRQPLRHALDQLRDATIQPYETTAAKYFKDPWQARNNYIHVILNRDENTLQQFLQNNTTRSLTPEETTTALELMELQRQLQLMYTSCGWFFDELSGIETIQIMQYASRAIQLAQWSLNLNLEPQFIQQLQHAKSNIPTHKDGQNIYNEYVKTAHVDITRVGAHYAVMNLFKPTQNHHKIYAFTIQQHETHNYDTPGPIRLNIGRATIHSNITLHTQDITYATLHLGDHNIIVRIQKTPPNDTQHYQNLHQQLTQPLQTNEIPNIIRTLDQHLPDHEYTIRSLFKDQRQQIINQILQTNLQQAEAQFRSIFDNNATFMHFLKSVNIPQPEILKAVGRHIIGIDLRHILQNNVPDPTNLQRITSEATQMNLPLDGQGVELALNNAILNRTRQLTQDPHNHQALQALYAMTDLADQLPFHVNFWQAQNTIYHLAQTHYPEKQQQAQHNNPQATQWLTHFRNLAAKLKINID